MTAYRDALSVDARSSPARLQLAAELLARRTGVVLFEARLALRSTVNGLLCEVIDPMPSGHRCANEYEVLVENARRALEASSLHSLLPAAPQRWVVVDDHGSVTVELWHAP